MNRASQTLNTHACSASHWPRRWILALRCLPQTTRYRAVLGYLRESAPGPMHARTIARYKTRRTPTRPFPPLPPTASPQPRPTLLLSLPLALCLLLARTRSFILLLYYATHNPRVLQFRIRLSTHHCRPPFLFSYYISVRYFFSAIFHYCRRHHQKRPPKATAHSPSHTRRTLLPRCLDPITDALPILGDSGLGTAVSRNSHFRCRLLR